MITGICVERATLADAEEILALQKLAYQSEAILYDDSCIPPLTQTLAGMQEDLINQTVLKACQGERILGSVRAFTRDGTCFIGRLIVHPDSQGQGLGKLLMGHIEDYFPEVQRFELFTGHKSARNLHLYRKLGYQIYKEQVVSERLTLFFMEKHTTSVPN